MRTVGSVYLRGYTVGTGEAERAQTCPLQLWLKSTEPSSCHTGCQRICQNYPHPKGLQIKSWYLVNFRYLRIKHYIAFQSFPYHEALPYPFSVSVKSHLNDCFLSL